MTKKSEKVKTDVKVEKKDENPLFTVGKWKGLDNYECKFCPFATLDEKTIFQHYVEKHAPSPEPKPPVIVPVYNRWGKLVK